MSDESQIPSDAPAPEERVDAPPPILDEPAYEAPAAAADPHPEFIVAGAFAGAFVFAKLLRRIGGAK